jgi:hypothetical protein
VPATRLGKARQLGRDHDRRHVFDVHLAGGGRCFKVSQGPLHGHAHAAEHGFHALRRERHIRAIARALQTHHQAVADELVAALGGQISQILDAVGTGSRGHQNACGQGQADE